MPERSLKAVRTRADDQPVDAVAQVTYLFTDIEGSTTRWQDDADAMSLDLARHFDILSVAVERHGGTVVQDTGDGIFAAFSSATAAVGAAVDAQRDLGATTWHDGRHLQVRMGIHTGMADAGSRQYRGTSVNRCSRVMDAAHGGQVLLSESTWAIVRDRPPDGVDFVDLGEHQLKDLRHPERLVQVVAPGLPAEFPPPRTRQRHVTTCPYRGLAAFQPEDADRFFGRDALVDQLVAKLAGSNFLAVLGPSGSGKSSLVRAGLLPRLGAGGLPGSQDWPTVMLTPGPRPVDELAARLADLTGQNPTEIGPRLREDPRQVGRVVDQCLAGRGAGSRLVVLVDQFEEVFTLCDDDEERRAFVAAILAISTPTGARGLTVLALRADFYGRCADHPDLAAQLTRTQVLVGPMGPEELRAAIIEPARAHGLQVEPALVDEVVAAAAGEAGGLPLVSHAMVETWLRRDGTTLTLAGYREAGGVQGAIARTAESVYQQRFDNLEQAVARLLLLRLVEPTAQAEDTRRPAALDELRPAGVPDDVVDDVLDELVSARLVTVTEDTAELAHEALIREWPTLSGWLEEGRDALRLQRHLTEAARAWEGSGRDDGELYRGARLAAARELLDAGELSPSESERHFLDASWARQQREQEESRRVARRLRLLLAATAAGLVVALIAGAVAIQQGRRANDQRVAAEAAADEADRQRARAEDAARTATARELAAAAVASLESDPELSILLAVEAVQVTRRHDGSVLPEAEAALHRAVQASRVVARFPGSTGVALGPEDERLVVTSTDGPLHVYDVASGDEVLVLEGHEGRPLNVDVSDDGELIASSGFDDGTLRIWSADEGEAIRRIDVGAPVFTPVFSPDGQLIAAPAIDGLTRVWDVDTGDQLHAFEAVGGLAFSPDGSRLTVADADAGARSWDVQQGELVATFDRIEALDVSYHPDGGLLATGHTDGFIALWDAATGELTRTIPTPTGSPVDNLTFDKQGSRLAVTDREGSIRILDVDSGQQRLVLPAPGPLELHFTADGDRLVAGTAGGAALLWDVSSTGARDLAAFVIPEPFGLAVSFLPDGEAVAVAGADFDPPAGSVTTFPVDGSLPDTVPLDEGIPGALFGDGERLHALTARPGGGAFAVDVPGGEPGIVLEDYDLALYGASPSPDGRLLVTFGFDPTEGAARFDPAAAQVWDLTTGRLLHRLRAHDLSILAAAFSPDGTRLVTASQDETAVVWDTSTWQEVAKLEGHADNVESATFTPDGSRVVTASTDGTLRVWDAATGDEVATLTGHTAAVLFVTFTPDGRLLSAGSDSTLRSWDLDRGVAVQELPIPRGSFAFDVSPDGKRLATLDFIDSLAHVVTLDVDELLEIAAQRVTRDLTAQECRRHLAQLTDLEGMLPAACADG